MTRRLFKQGLLLTALLCLVVLGIGQPVRAAETTLDSASYGYGSTSEFSQSSPITVTTVSPQTTASKTAETLAPTGQSVVPVYIASFSLLAAASLLFGYVYYRYRHATPVQ